MSTEETTNINVIPADKEKIKHLLTVTAKLAILTAFEFIIAFTMVGGAMKTGIFIVMTIVKAFYIVGEFMHLKHEVKTLIWSILIPMIFVVWLLIALRYESWAILTARGW